jgi:hypothetical protein
VASFSVRSLIQAIAGAVSGAQAAVQRAQIIELGRYFEPDSGDPRILKVRLPAQRPDGATTSMTWGVPLLTLAPPSQLRIKEAEFAFDIELADLGAKRAETVTVADDFASEVNRLTANAQPGVFGGKTAMKVTLRVEHMETAEGVARLLAELNRRSGPVGGKAEP